MKVLANFTIVILLAVHGVVLAQPTADGCLSAQNNGHPDFVKICELAAKSGEALAIYRLASLYVAGRGVERDIPKARQLFESAALKGHAPSMAAMSMGHSIPSVEFVAWRTLYVEFLRDDDPAKQAEAYIAKTALDGLSAQEKAEAAKRTAELRRRIKRQ